MATAKENTYVGPSRHYRTAWTGTPVDYNILENGPGGSVGCQFGYCCRWIVVGGPTGPIVVRDQFDQLVTIPLAVLQARPEQRIQAKALVADGSSAASIVVYW